MVAVAAMRLLQMRVHNHWRSLCFRSVEAEPIWLSGSPMLAGSWRRSFRGTMLRLLPLDAASLASLLVQRCHEGASTLGFCIRNAASVSVADSGARCLGSHRV